MWVMVFDCLSAVIFVLIVSVAFFPVRLLSPSLSLSLNHSIYFFTRFFCVGDIKQFVRIFFFSGAPILRYDYSNFSAWLVHCIFNRNFLFLFFFFSKHLNRNDHWTYPRSLTVSLNTKLIWFQWATRNTSIILIIIQLKTFLDNFNR